MQKIKTAEEIIRSLHEREPDSKAADYVTELESNGYTLSLSQVRRRIKKYGIPSREEMVLQAVTDIMSQIDVKPHELKKLLENKGFARSTQHCALLIKSYKDSIGIPSGYTMKKRDIQALIVKAIKNNPGATDKEISAYMSQNGLPLIDKTVRNHRMAMKIGSSYQRKQNFAFSYLDDNPDANEKELRHAMWDRGYTNFNQSACFEYMAKYKTVQAERLAVKALWNQPTKQAA